MPSIDEFYSNKLDEHSTYYSNNMYTMSNSTNYEQNMQTYLCLSAICSSSTITTENFNDSRSMSRSMSRCDIIEIPKEWTNKGIF